MTVNNATYAIIWVDEKKSLYTLVDSKNDTVLLTKFEAHDTADVMLYDEIPVELDPGVRYTGEVEFLRSAFGVDL